MPVEDSLKLGDHQWQWAARLRLGMDVPVVDDACSGCKSTTAYRDNSWHALSCVALSGADMTLRHNSVVSLLAQFCSLMGCPSRVEPVGCSDDSNERPDIQMDLMDVTVLADVTITHAAAKSHRKAVAAQRSADCVGAASEARKNKKYAEDARQQHKQFLPFVLYTYGGFHRTALAVISAMANSLEPARCLLSVAAWRQQLMQSIAIAIQRGNAGIMVTASQQRRAAAHNRLVLRNRLRFEQPSAGGVRHAVSSAAALAAAAPCPVSQQPAAVTMDVVEAEAGGTATQLGHAGHATSALCLAATELLDTSGLTPYQCAMTPADRAVTAAVTDSGGDSWWEHQVPDAARAINAWVATALRHDTTPAAAVDIVGSVAAGAVGTTSGTTRAPLRDDTVCAAVSQHGHELLAAAAGLDNCTHDDITAGYACPGQEPVALSDADTEVLDASDSDSQADAAGSSPDDAAARKCGGSVLDNSGGVLGVATPRTLRSAGQLRSPE